MEINAHIVSQLRDMQLEPLYAAAFAPLQRFAARGLGAELEMMAEDCVQDAIFAAYQRRDSFREPWQLKSFLYTATHNNVVSARRKQGSRSHYLQQLTPDEALVDDSLRAQIIEQEALDRLYAVIDSLPQDLREVFDLNFSQGLKLAEVAEALGMSESGVKRRRARLLRYFREKLGQDAPILLLFVMGMGRWN